MRILVLSDLHVELAPFRPRPVACDLVVLAGDIHNGIDAIRWARASFDGKPIVQIAGNHEFWGTNIGETRAALREEARRQGVHFLDDERVTIGGITFLGCTLWTDYQVFERDGRTFRMSTAQAMRANQRLIADHRRVRIDDGAGGERLFLPEDAARLHARSRQWLASQLRQPAAGPRVVITHHLPSWRSVVPEYARWVTNAAFVSDLDRWLPDADCWIHGHTHTSHRYRVRDTTVVCNPRGYPDRRIEPRAFENPAFQPGLTVDVGG